MGVTSEVAKFTDDKIIQQADSNKQTETQANHPFPPQNL